MPFNSPRETLDGEHLMGVLTTCKCWPRHLWWSPRRRNIRRSLLHTLRGTIRRRLWFKNSRPAPPHSSYSKGSLFCVPRQFDQAMHDMAAVLPDLTDFPISTHRQILRIWQHCMAVVDVERWRKKISCDRLVSIFEPPLTFPPERQAWHPPPPHSIPPCPLPRRIIVTFRVSPHQPPLPPLPVAPSSKIE